MKNPSELVACDLEASEVDLLAHGLGEWGGPARCTDPLARAMGFVDVNDFLAERARIRTSLSVGSPLSRWDWTRALLATEVAFASDVVGSGVEWPTTTGMDDEATIKVLRNLQRKLGPIRVSPEQPSS